MGNTPEYQRRWKASHPEKIAAYHQLYQERHREQIKERERCRIRNPKLTRAYIQKSNKKLRIAVLTHYGGSPPRCACCGEQAYEFLAIDHINGRPPGAARQRDFYRHLRQNGFPSGFRVLCHNCNCARGFYGYCPHEKIEDL